MALRLDDKKTIVTELSQVIANSVSAIAAEYRGLSVSAMTELRMDAHKAGVHMRIYKNTLARRAVKETPFACLTEALVGPVVLMFSHSEPGAAAKLLRTYVKKHESLKVKALAVGGELLGPDRLEAVASLPSRDEAIAQLMSVMQAPVVQFVRTLKEPYAQAVRVLAAIRDQKQAAA